MSTIRIEADDLIRKLTSLAQFRKVKAAMVVAGKHIRGKIAVKPPSPGGRAQFPQPAGFKSAKQRRFFFWALKSGVIDVPYRRGASPGSEKLAQSWTTESANSGMTAIVGNDTSYGRLVQDAPNQAAYHKTTGWVTVQDVIRDEGPTVVKFVRDAIQREIDG